MSDSDHALSPDTPQLIEPDVDVFGAVDPDEQPGVRRKRYGALVAGVAVAALVGGLLIWQPWSSDEAAAPTTTAPALSSELVIDVDGVALSRSLQSSGGMDQDQAQDGFIFVGPDASLETGPYLAFLVDDLDGDTIDPGDSETTLEINGHEAVVEDNEGNIEVYWEGEPGVRYGVAGAGVSQAQVIAFAEAVSFDGGITTVNDADAIDGLEPAGDIDTLFGILSMVVPFFSTDAASITLEYGTEQGDTITLTSIEASGDFSALAALMLDDERIVEVDGEQVVIGVVDDSFSAEGDLQVLLVLRGGQLIGITATDIDDDGLLALLAGVRPASDDEWAEVLSVVEDPMDDFLGGDSGEDSATVPASALPDDTEP